VTRVGFFASVQIKCDLMIKQAGDVPTVPLQISKETTSVCHLYAGRCGSLSYRTADVVRRQSVCNDVTEILWSAMSFLPNIAIFCELQLVHETGYFLQQPTLEECWHQVTTSTCLSLSF